MKIELVFAAVNRGLNNRLISLATDPDYVKTNWLIHDLDTLPQWIQERIAMLRLLEQDEETELGAWYSPYDYTPAREEVQAVFAIVRQPGDPEWED